MESKAEATGGAVDQVKGKAGKEYWGTEKAEEVDDLDCLGDGPVESLSCSSFHLRVLRAVRGRRVLVLYLGV
eukprot:72506-Hanusia_phi.AAC.1